MNKVIITGANGFIGSNLCKKLVENNISVVAIGRSFKENRLPDSPLITKIEIELSGTIKLSEYIPDGEYDAFYHFAWKGVNGLEKADPVVQIENVQIALNCAKAAKETNCKKYLCAGTIAERTIESLPYLSTTSGGMMYGAAKHCAHIMVETYCKNIGLDFVWMQFSNIYGPSNKTGNLVSYTLSELLAGKKASFGPAIQPYDFIFVDDLIEATYRLGLNNTKSNCYFIGSGEPRLLKEYLLEIAEKVGKDELVGIGERADDGIVYNQSMFDVSKLVEDIGEYVSGSFSDLILYTIKNY